MAADASRAAASSKNQRTRAKAEVFEDALARVSRRLAALARQSAAELRAERLAAARGPVVVMQRRADPRGGTHPATTVEPVRPPRRPAAGATAISRAR